MIEEDPLAALRSEDVAAKIGSVVEAEELNVIDDVLSDFLSSGVGFASTSSELTAQWHRAVALLLSCVMEAPGGGAMLSEGGVYHGCWLESTGTISTEILSRFCPASARSTFDIYPRFQRKDGLLPYKVTADGPSYRQIQMVTPLARSVWNHFRLNGRDKSFLDRQYRSLRAYDDWLSTYRDTRGSGGVEAFCTFDTGHDLSPRFWHVPDTAFMEDATRFDPDSPVLPFIAPDLTAYVYCSRRYLSLMAEELGTSEVDWGARASDTLTALRRECYDADEEMYYDRDRNGRLVKVQSDLLLRVLACEVGDERSFARSLDRYLLNTRKFFARYPLTSIALDDPRFDPHQEYNSWGGTTNFLTLLRTPHAFEHHGHFTELTWILQPSIAALTKATRFGQNISPWTGEEGFTSVYSPALLSLVDFVERLSGILPRPDGTVWFTGLTPSEVGAAGGVSTAYRREVGGRSFEFAVERPDRNGNGRARMLRDGTEQVVFPRGLRLVTDSEGAPVELVGVTSREVEGEVRWRGQAQQIRLSGNRRARFEGERVVELGGSERGPDVVLPSYS